MISESQVSTFNSKLRPQKVYRPQDFEVGVIFAAPWFEVDSNKRALESGEPDYNRSMTSVGPIYTHGGKGLSRKRASQKDEFISIREYDSQDSAAPSETPYDILWVDRYPEFKGDSKSSWYAMTDFTSAHFTEICVHKYDNKCTIQGKLKPQSKKYLQTLVTETLAVAIAETRKFAESTTIQELQNLSLRKPSIKSPADDFGKLRGLALNRRSGGSVHSRTE
ncbi:hypothetical protein B0O99DRAFT_689598 [Bisporella sp. PMI_857]|nr:hypothetical protein B0O99DRAFT_689598 [Bisporella sp. PMI_857]